MTFRTISKSDPQFETNGLSYLTVKSPALQRRADVSVYVPLQAKGLNNVPAIILLHGVYGSHWAWTMKGGAHLTLNRMIVSGELSPFILVMPSDGLWGDGSGYLPHPQQNYEAWIGAEVPALVRQEVSEIGEASDFYIAGLSMGGFGAFWVGIQYADAFQGISGHSSITTVQEISLFVEEDWSFWDAEKKVNSIAELILADPEKVPPFRFDCGLGDELLASNQVLHQKLLAANISHEYQEYPGGHEWPYWQEHVRESFLFFDSLRIS